MSNQPPGHTPALYEDRTLFPTPVQEPPGQHNNGGPSGGGISALGVIIVAFIAAAVAGGIVWFASSSNGGGGGATNSQITELQQENARLAKMIKEFEENQAQEQITSYEEKIAALEAQVANFGSYGRLAELEQQIAEQKAEIERLIAQPERQRMPASAREIPQPENDTDWVSRVEDELEAYLKVLEDRVEWVASWPARNPPPPCSDPENC